MYAPQPPRPSRDRATPKKPLAERRRRLSSSESRQRDRAFRQEVVQEVGAKLLVNLILTVVALVYLGRLVRYNLAQEEKLERLHAEVAAVDSRVSNLQREFAVRFDTHQTQQLVRQQRHRVSPNQLQIVWTAPPDSVTPADASELEGIGPDAPPSSSQPQ